MKTNNDAFNTKWWDEFLAKNKNFTEPCVMKDCLDQSYIDLLNNGIVEMLQERYKVQHVDRGFRVYVEGVEQNSDFCKNLSLNPPKENENLSNYFGSIFDKKFGMIINSGEKYSEIFADSLLIKLKPLIDHIGLPTSGLELTIFIGNYGWTPLGIHQDHKGENVLHFHLGPGEKTMYTWNEDKYHELTKTKHNNKDIEPLLEYANEFPFGAGDLFYMPWNKFHVGFSDQFSIGITLWFNNPTKYGFTNKIIRSFVNQYVEENANVLTPQKDYIKNDDSFNELMETLRINDNLKEKNVTDFFKHIYEEYKYSILSNGGWQSVPLNREIRDKYIVDDYEFIDNKKIKSKKGYDILYKTNNEVLDIFVRGSKVEMSYFPEIINLINRINSHETLSVKDLLDDNNEDFPKEAGLYFLSLLYDKRGIDIV